MHEELVSAAREAGAWLQARNWRLVTAESCTGGLVAAAITEIAGSSGWFDRGFVTYTNESKQEQLGVHAATLQQFGAVSEATVREMAFGALRASKADVAIAISGIAGPGGGSPDKPVGTVCLAWARKEEPLSDVVALTAHFEGGRSAVRLAASLLALQALSNRA
ncbi:nicotinamide-nucleotide amidohydrolase family protein [Uliginosibacterium sp. H3]|uniref:Nicotinamide-nucleotide amidohydrolase family protein n=1 Tax=Uliginosibacterium silvisoli TaxID=3114758 RepID=A0ABU6K272_9RHOO|nr:nicotinamide-nucleotide amidohydrolase family protein [Uliginosibacterium sp. H3]